MSDTLCTPRQTRVHLPRVSDTGELLVRTPDGVLREVGSGEVSVRLQPEPPEA